MDIEIKSVFDLNAAERRHIGEKDVDYCESYRPCNFLMLKDGEGNIVEYHDDSMEPEDVSFFRDLSWIKPLIEKLVQQAVDKQHDATLGKQDGIHI